MKYRQICAALLASLLILLLIPAQCVLGAETSENTLTLTTQPSVQTVMVGESVTYTFALTGNQAPGINGYEFHLSYDQTVLEYQSHSFALTNGTDAQSSCTPDGDALHIYWTRSAATVLNIDLLSVTFKTLKSGNATVTPQLTGDDCFSLYGFVSNTFHDIDYPVDLLPATVTVTPNYSTVPYFAVSSVSGGTTATTEVTLNNVSNICGGQVALTYDPTKLEFVSGENSSFFTHGFVACNTPGKVLIAGGSSSANAVSGSGLMATVTFKLIDENRVVGDSYDLGLEFYIPSQPIYSREDGKTINITEVYTQTGTVTVETVVNPYDLNADNAVDISDVTLLLDYLADPRDGIFAPGLTGELDGVTGIDISDVTALLDVLSNT